jgi:hypothetical protein
MMIEVAETEQRFSRTFVINPSDYFVVYCRPDTSERRMAQTKAWVNGNFWLPCPLCGNTFGGHEWIGRITLPMGRNVAYSAGVCPDCEAYLLRGSKESDSDSGH